MASLARSLMRKGGLDRDLDEELRSYVDLRAQELMASGIAPDQARRQAKVELGGIEQVKERVRDRRRGAGIDTLLQDVRHGLRVLGKNPAFSLVAILSLGIGISATTTVFSAVHSALLRPIAFSEPDRLVAAQKTYDGVPSGPVSRLDYFDYRDQSRSFEHLAAAVGGSAQLTVRDGPEPWVADVGMVSWNLFRALKVTPVAGRDFLPADEAQGGAAVALVSYGVWQDRFGASPTAVGRTVNLAGHPVTIIGVMPSGFHFLDNADLWTLVDRTGPVDATRDSHSHIVVGRLRPGVSVQQAQGDVDRVSRALATQYPATNKAKGLRLIGLQAFMVQNIGTILVLLGVATASVLLIACANVAGLLLARGHRRMPEMAMRSALGASRPRLFRQLLTESVLLALAGGLLGVGGARLVQAGLQRMLPWAELGVAAPAVEGPVLLFALAMSLAAGVAIGLVPAVRGTEARPSAALGSGRQAPDGPRGSRLRSGLVIAQVAGSSVLLTLAVLLMRSVVGLTAVDLGFEPDQVFTARVLFSGPEYDAPERRRALFESVLEDVKALPGVTSASMISKLPILNPGQDWGIWPAGRPPAASGDAYHALARWVTPGYFKTVGIPILEGRDISETDLPGAPQAIVISKAVAETLFPGRSPVGELVTVWSTEGSFQVVGVVGDARLSLLLGQRRPAMYMSSVQMGSPATRLAIRASGDPAQLAGAVRQIVRGKDSGLSLVDARTLAVIVGEALSPFRTVSVSLGAFAAVALLLAAIGLYGTLAYHVGQHRLEMGVRLAVGAAPPSLLCRVLGRGLALAAVGLILGIVIIVPGALLLRQLPVSLQFESPSVYLGAILALGLTTSVACLLPAWQAARIDPIEVLRRQ